jgi:hypothetical protein
MEVFTPGTHVTYDDEPLDNPEVTGVVVEPTKEELEWAKTFEYPPRPEAGDVLVQWNYDWRADGLGDRSWENVRDLQRLESS